MTEMMNKMDELLQKFEAVEQKMDNRMCKIENEMVKIKKKAVLSESKQNVIVKEVDVLKSTVNMLQQDKLENNIILRGIPEIETDQTSLSNMVEKVLFSISKQISLIDTFSVRRLGPKKDGGVRPTVCKFISVEKKLLVMQNKKDFELTCDKFKTNEVPWGTKNNKIFINDQLTPGNATIYYHVRQLKKQKKIKYGWTKLGRVYVKENDDSRAIHVKSVQHLQSISQMVIQIESGSESESDNESEGGYSTSASKRKAENSPQQHDKKKVKHKTTLQAKIHRSTRSTTQQVQGHPKTILEKPENNLHIHT